MSFRVICLFVTSLVAAAFSLASEQQDAIRAALEKAKEEFQASSDKSSTALMGKFDERIKLVSETGNLDAVLELRSDKKAFDVDGTAPKSKLMKTAYAQHQDSIRVARKKLSEAYELAIKEYTKALDTDQAEEVRNEYLAFRTGLKLARGPVPKAGQEYAWEIAPGVKMTFCWIPTGKAQLGASLQEQANLTKIMPGGRRQSWQDAESEQFRPIFVSGGFWLGKYEVTQDEWTAVMATNPSEFNGKNVNKAKGLDTLRFPVENVSWNDCQDFLKKLNAQAGAAEKALGTRVRFALPHEDEWEYACRGGKGNGQPFYFGSLLDGKQANCDGTVPWGAAMAGPKLGRTTTVGSYEKDHPHLWGLADMHGNVEEWCENKYNPREEARVLRGGNWAVAAWGCRAANRYKAAPGTQGDKSGFRVCLRPI